jgi:hypothetical protein
MAKSRPPRARTASGKKATSVTRAQAEPASRDSLIDPWRMMRITAEFVEGFDALAGIRKGVTIFGSARTGPDDPQYAAAHETARLLAGQGFSILFGRVYWAGPSNPD